MAAGKLAEVINGKQSKACLKVLVPCLLQLLQDRQPLIRTELQKALML